MAILITGSKGFIGSHLTLFLKERGCEVILFDSDISDKKNVEDFRTREKIEAIVHLAAVFGKEKKEIFEKVNVLGTENIVTLARRLNVGRLIFLSSTRTLSSLSNPYVNSKRKAEKLIMDSGLPYVIIRSSMVYGPGDRNNLGFLFRIAEFLPVLPVVDFKLQPIYIGDLVKIIFSCLDIPANKIFNVAGPEIISLRDILKELKSLGYKFFPVYLPSFFSHIIKRYSWRIESLLNNELYEVSPWEKLFNLKATSFKEGIYKTVKL